MSMEDIVMTILGQCNLPYLGQVSICGPAAMVKETWITYSQKGRNCPPLEF